MTEDPAGVVARLRAGTAPWVVATGDEHGPGPTPGDVVALDDEAAHHLRRVLRRRNGDAVVVTDGTGGAAGGRLVDDGIEVDCWGHEPAPAPALRVVQGVGKRGRHDDVVRMLTELGVDRVTAATTARCQVQLAHKADRVRERWQGIAVSACAQSRRTHLPVLDGPGPLDEVMAGSLERVLVAHPGAPAHPLAAVREVTDRSPNGAHGPWTAVVGPEGGLADHEVEDLVARGAVPVRLGPTVLRTEHAGLALAAVMAAALGRM